MTFQGAVDRTVAVTKKHAPEILTGLTVTGIAGTAVLSARAGYKSGLLVMADSAARTIEGEDEVRMSGKEIVRETWRFYLPTLAVGLIAVAASVGSNRISTQRQMAVISAAALSERAFQEYRDKVIETTTKPKEQKIRDDIAQQHVDDKKSELSNLTISRDGDVLCLELYTGRTFISNAEKIRRAENDANRDCLNDGSVTMNVFHSYLGLPYTDAGEVVGWNNSIPLDVKLGAAVHDGAQPVLTIGYYTPPSVKFDHPF